jgi:hypothetical protein
VRSLHLNLRDVIIAVACFAALLGSRVLQYSQTSLHSSMFGYNGTVCLVSWSCGPVCYSYQQQHCSVQLSSASAAGPCNCCIQGCSLQAAVYAMHHMHDAALAALCLFTAFKIVL